jgi:HEAT repeat protein
MSLENIDALFARALSGDYEDELAWEAVGALRREGSREVFDRAAEWCGSENPLARARAVDVLAQLGRTIEHPTNAFPEESYSVVSGLLQCEKDTRPISSAIAALGHIDNPLAIPLISRYILHPNPEIRYNVAFALGCFPNDPLALEGLLVLMRDADDEVRDWATFGSGVLGDADSLEIREALFRQLSDSNQDVREEAIVGLSKRKDERVLSFLIAALQQPSITDRVREAAQMLLDMTQDRRDWSGVDYAAALLQRFSI